jgi:hypothetical protein
VTHAKICIASALLAALVVVGGLAVFVAVSTGTVDRWEREKVAKRNAAIVAGMGER